MEPRKWNSLSINLGKPGVDQERRAAYEAAALEDGVPQLSKWAREILDQAASFDEKKAKETAS